MTGEWADAEAASTLLPLVWVEDGPVCATCGVERVSPPLAPAKLNPYGEVAPAEDLHDCGTKWPSVWAAIVDDLDDECVANNEVYDVLRDMYAAREAIVPGSVRVA
jgi:hypothetical protein